MPTPWKLWQQKATLIRRLPQFVEKTSFKREEHFTFCEIGIPFSKIPAINRARMSEHNIADLLALDTGALKSRLSELRRYL